ncbi:sensor histidine kinase [candidate division KSB1 bacterium]|nr:sensor histidine kinase [candidate division KSB1 bacterium]
MFKRIYFQIIFWAIIAGINIGFTVYFLPLRTIILSTLFVLFFQMFVFYFNVGVLFPRYFSLKNTGRFVLITAAFIVFVTLCQTMADYYYFSKLILKGGPFGRPHMMMILMRSFFWLSFIDMISTVYMMQNRIREQSEQTQRLIAEKLNTELKLLKAQINPHFIFNTLNNIYSLSYMKSEKAPEGILKLSQMLRYVIEECEGEKVTLKSEIEYIENYIAFQKMKTPNEQNIFFEYFNTDSEILIPPMLFMPFIENSFKYSKIEEQPQSFIKIKLTTDHQKINFTIRNSVPKSGRPKPGAGTGIDNVKKRLNIIFPDKHTLSIHQENNEFIVDLRLLIL